MRFNIKKIAAIGASVLLAGMTTGFAAAAAFPAPFVQGGAANVAIVYGTGAGVSPLDLVQAGNIQTALQSYVTSAGTNTILSTSGEVASLDTSSSRIYLNASLNSVKQVLTNLDMPNTLATTSFSGNVQVQVSPSIILGNGTSSGVDNSGKVIFTKQPSSSVDPVVGVSEGVVTATPLYNETLTFSQAINFTDPQSIGSVLTLFGNQFTVASSTSSANGLILFGSAQTVTLSQGSAGASTATVNVNGTSHTVSLSNVGTTSAYVSIDGASAVQVTSGTSKTVNGVNIAVTNVASSNAGGNTATILVGANQLTFADGQSVTVGTTNTPILGTMVSFQGGSITSLSKLTIAVYAPDTLHDAILPGQSFVDPVFGGFQFGFAGMSFTPNLTTDKGIVVGNSGNSLMQVTFSDWNSNRNTINFANNQSNATAGFYNLSDVSGNSILPFEGGNVTLNAYVPIGNQNYGHLFQLQSVTLGATGTNNSKWLDIMNGASFTANAPTGSATGVLNVDGRQYNVYMGGSGAAVWAQIKYPTADSANAGTFVLYPTIQTKNGAQMEIYSPLLVYFGNFTASTLLGNGTQGGPNGGSAVTPTGVAMGGATAALSAFNIPNGNGYTTITVTTATGNSSTYNYTLTPSTGSADTITTNATLKNATIQVGQLKYQFVPNGTGNWTYVYLIQPGNTSTGQLITTPSIIDIEAKDVNSNYNAVVIPTQLPSTLVGVGTTYFSNVNYQSPAKQLQSNNKLTQYMDFMGTVLQLDTTTSSQTVATLWNVANATQAYAQLYIGSIGSSVSAGGSSALGQILVKDSQVSSVASDNLIVVGGSCINSAAATLVGGAFCGSDWTSATGVGSGQFLIQSFNSSINSNGLVALLVAGYDAPDTVNAATYLANLKPDTSFGNKYVGTTSTSAQLQVSH